MEPDSITYQALHELWRKWWWLITLLLIFSVAWIVIGLGWYIDAENVWIGPFFALAPIAVLFYYIKIDFRARFWRHFAQQQGWPYAAHGSTAGESALMFAQGHNRQINNLVGGIWQGRPLRLFEYVFQTGSGKHKKNHNYTIFELRFNGAFPHIYLDHHHNQYSVGRLVGTRLSLPPEFAEHFHLYGPREYEIEVLQLFTPDILEYLLDSQFNYDIELVESELLVFTEGWVDSEAELWAEFRVVEGLLQLLSSSLDRMSFQAIGSRPHHLRD